MEGLKIIEGPTEGVEADPSSGKSGVVWEDLLAESCLPTLVGARNWGIPVDGHYFPGFERGCPAQFAKNSWCFALKRGTAARRLGKREQNR